LTLYFIELHLTADKRRNFILPKLPLATSFIRNPLSAMVKRQGSNQIFVLNDTAEKFSAKPFGYRFVKIKEMQSQLTIRHNCSTFIFA